MSIEQVEKDIKSGKIKFTPGPGCSSFKDIVLAIHLVNEAYRQGKTRRIQDL